MVLLPEPETLMTPANTLIPPSYTPERRRAGNFGTWNCRSPQSSLPELLPEPEILLNPAYSSLNPKS